LVGSEASQLGSQASQNPARGCHWCAHVNGSPVNFPRGGNHKTLVTTLWNALFDRSICGHFLGVGCVGPKQFPGDSPSQILLPFAS
jgi:hypothetical protein